ncbi:MULTISPECIES: LPS export ABC transporter ATP-binding protein [Thermodesulfovibrio]|jgi:lipopolysaccharide export system ATP-binding protein|uniref:Lipopolysaccharide export system ATP-binding protein LptB n=2 Tax=Thermodesulfovibrio yellowstonii TaxID=28262 RepID=B5YI15_THEYD|nr:MULTISPECIES: LPS export ABC transporter ATP-binding protein [Thermodesulfovibrio]ACI21836.1 unclassified ABC-type transport system, ATPase component [Thermodesulfovibrio yellowstonii DSM 11347]MDI6864696.1 LPS export ABC transporter ATP-binding protein [Thermodesulfovibrio yellowstonii]GLI54418.1 ABC transporter ATP-binding protein [Thermodesulfovibrio islandicus]
MSNTLKVEKLKKSFGKKEAVKGVSFKVESGEVVGLLGPNGAGKTTTFYMITGIIKPDNGNIFLDDKNISSMPIYERAKLGLGYLPQEPSIFRKLTVRDNLKAVLEIKYENDKDALAKIDEEVNDILKEFNLLEFADREGYKLSGGERRRAEIARAISLKPIFMLFDEPFAGIDPLAVVELKKTIKHLKDKGIGVIITDHNVRETLSITDRAFIIHNGKLLAEGSPDTLVNDPVVREAYLGEEFKL